MNGAQLSELPDSLAFISDDLPKSPCGLARNLLAGQREEFERAVDNEYDVDIGAALLAIVVARSKLRAAAGGALLVLDALMALDPDAYHQEHVNLGPLIEIVLGECRGAPFAAGETRSLEVRLARQRLRESASTRGDAPVTVEKVR